MASDLEKKIQSQIEYYFGDINLPRDKFLQEKIKEDDGWVTLDVLLTFNRLSNLSKDKEVIAAALEKSEKKLIELSECKSKVRRSPESPLPVLNEERQKELLTRTAYAKGFGLEDTMDEILKYLSDHGDIESCQRRSYLDSATKEHKFKGSCFIIFKSVDDCKKFIEAESIKYKDKDLIRKWQATYNEEKKEEILKRKNKNKKVVEEKPVVKRTIPAGTVLHFSGITSEKEISRDIIKEKIGEIFKKNISYIDYSKGLTEGYVRFEEENSGTEFFEKLEEGKFTVDEVVLNFKTLTKEEEDAYSEKIAKHMAERKKNGNNPRNSRKRRGGGHHNYSGKRRK